MKKILLLAAGTLAFATACNNGSSSTGAATPQGSTLFCAAPAETSSPVQAVISPDHNSIVITSMTPSPATPNTDANGSANPGDDAAAGDLPSAGIAFTRNPNNGVSTSDTGKTYFSAPGEDPANPNETVTLAVDSALLDGATTGGISFNDKTYACSTDAASVSPTPIPAPSENDSGNGNNNGADAAP